MEYPVTLEDLAVFTATRPFVNSTLTKKMLIDLKH